MLRKSDPQPARDLRWRNEPEPASARDSPGILFRNKRIDDRLAVPVRLKQYHRHAQSAALRFYRAHLHSSTRKTNCRVGANQFFELRVVKFVEITGSKLVIAQRIEAIAIGRL